MLSHQLSNYKMLNITQNTCKNVYTVHTYLSSARKYTLRWDCLSRDLLGLTKGNTSLIITIMVRKLKRSKNKASCVLDVVLWVHLLQGTYHMLQSVSLLYEFHLCPHCFNSALYLSIIEKKSFSIHFIF